MEDAVSSLCFPSFFEPVSVLDDLGADASPKLLGLMAPALNAWTRHIGYGTIARIRDWRSLSESEADWIWRNLLDPGLVYGRLFNEGH
jgi:hypothetical protein